jgi:hypothetical protein
VQVKDVGRLVRPLRAVRTIMPNVAVDVSAKLHSCGRKGHSTVNLCRKKLQVKKDDLAEFC